MLVRPLEFDMYGLFRLSEKRSGYATELGFNDLITDSVADQFRYRMKVEPSHDVGPMSFCRLEGDSQRNCDLLSTLSFC
jgi:hypothetical protein